MNTIARRTFDGFFTGLTGLAVVVLICLLLAILGPMVWRGVGAVVFKGTVEFRELQMSRYGRGDEAALMREKEEVQESRSHVYRLLDEFEAGINTESLIGRARDIHREFGEELRHREIGREEYQKLRSLTREIRDKLISAFRSDNKKEINAKVEEVLGYRSEERLDGTAAAKLFRLAEHYRESVRGIELGKRSAYEQGLNEVKEVVRELFGPRPGEPESPLLKQRYGATRWDRAQVLVDELLYAEKWVQVEAGEPLEKKKVARAEEFAGTKLEGLFLYVQANLEEMFHPRRTFYWQYFIDGSTPDHLYGGIWPELLGTLLITLVSMVFVIPLGIISAAYLVECAGDNIIIRVIRMCINTLAGVPSIVFGLFGLAFFVNFLLPAAGGPSKRCILAASLTLAILTLPVMIRASEEAIRTVPKPYKEASLALGASRFRTFIGVTLPAALPGILTGVILSLSRVAGETAPIIFTAAVASGPAVSLDSGSGWLFQSTPTLSFGSYAMAVKEDLTTVAPHKQYGMVVALIALILCLNGVAIVVRSRVFKKLQGR